MAFLNSLSYIFNKKGTRKYSWLAAILFLSALFLLSGFFFKTSATTNANPAACSPSPSSIYIGQAPYFASTGDYSSLQVPLKWQFTGVCNSSGTITSSSGKIPPCYGTIAKALGSSVAESLTITENNGTGPVHTSSCPVAVSNVSVSITPSTTTPKIGDTVTFTANPTPNDRKYAYNWNDTQNKMQNCQSANNTCKITAGSSPDSVSVSAQDNLGNSSSIVTTSITPGMPGLCCPNGTCQPCPIADASGCTTLGAVCTPTPPTPPAYTYTCQGNVCTSPGDGKISCSPGGNGDAFCKSQNNPTCDSVTQKCAYNGDGKISCTMDAFGDALCANQKWGCNGGKCQLGGTGNSCTIATEATDCSGQNQPTCDTATKTCKSPGDGNISCSLGDDTPCKNQTNYGCKGAVCQLGANGTPCTIATQAIDCNQTPTSVTGDICYWPLNPDGSLGGLACGTPQGIQGVNYAIVGSGVNCTAPSTDGCYINKCRGLAESAKCDDVNRQLKTSNYDKDECSTDHNNTTPNPDCVYTKCEGDSPADATCTPYLSSLNSKPDNQCDLTGDPKVQCVFNACILTGTGASCTSSVGSRKLHADQCLIPASNDPLCYSTKCVASTNGAGANTGGTCSVSLANPLPWSSPNGQKEPTKECDPKNNGNDCFTTQCKQTGVYWNSGGNDTARCDIVIQPHSDPANTGECFPTVSGGDASECSSSQCTPYGTCKQHYTGSGRTDTGTNGSSCTTDKDCSSCDSNKHCVPGYTAGQTKCDPNNGDKDCTPGTMCSYPGGNNIPSPGSGGVNGQPVGYNIPVGIAGAATCVQTALGTPVQCTPVGDTSVCNHCSQGVCMTGPAQTGQTKCTSDTDCATPSTPTYPNLCTKTPSTSIAYCVSTGPSLSGPALSFLGPTPPSECTVGDDSSCNHCSSGKCVPNAGYEITGEAKDGNTACTQDSQCNSCNNSGQCVPSNTGATGPSCNPANNGAECGSYCAMGSYDQSSCANCGGTWTGGYGMCYPLDPYCMYYSPGDPNYQYYDCPCMGYYGYVAPGNCPPGCQFYSMFPGYCVPVQ